MIITEKTDEMEKLGRMIIADNPKQYPESYFIKAKEKYGKLFDSDEELYSMLCRAIYSKSVYGTSIVEHVIYNFDKKSHEEKTQYLTWFGRYSYMTFLNRVKDIHQLDNKYEAYTALKPFYKREAMLLSDEDDFEEFCTFVNAHRAIFVKPNNLGLAEGVHPLEINEGDDIKAVFRSLLAEAIELSSKEITRQIDHRLILEEKIIPSSFINKINPYEMSLLRITTIYLKGKVHFFYPCIRIMYGDGERESGEVYSYDALIDSETGTVITNGKISNDEVEFHPITGIKIQGLVLPQWEELKQMLIEAAKHFPTIRYIGWDVTHTDKGWCIVEGNTNGEFFFQMCVNHGLKKEFEQLIGFSIPFGCKWDTIIQGDCELK